MITSLISLLGLLGGGFMRLVPELVQLWNKATDNGHELAMMDKQIELQKLKAADDRETIHAQGEEDRATIDTKSSAEQILAVLDAQKEALKGQMQLTGIRKVDTLNFLVRPLVTYFFVGLYGLVKLSMIVLAFQQTDAWQAVVQVWSVEDAGILSGILGFWFVGRVFDKKNR